jgi:cytochrome bd-type quinol oxidase subunit 2
MLLLTITSFNFGCYTLSVAGQVIHYRTWLFHNVETHKTHNTLSRVMNISGIVQVLFDILCVICVFAKCTPVEANWIRQ